MNSVATPFTDALGSTDRSNEMKSKWIVAALTLVCMFLAGWGAPKAGAAIDITEFSGGLTDNGGAPLLQAGAHPNFTTYLQFATESAESPYGFPYEKTKEAPQTVRVDLPPGLVGAASDFAECTEKDLVGGTQAFAAVCPIESQIGTLDAGLGAFPLYNMQPAKGTPATFATNILATTVRIIPHLRAAGGYHIGADVEYSSQGLNVKGVKVVLWGVPADSAHDEERYGLDLTVPPHSSAAPRTPLMSNPTSCGLPLTTSAAADSWENPEVFDHATFDEDEGGNPMTVTGCENVSFEPTATVQPTSRQAGAPTGLEVRIENPQSKNPDGPRTADVKDVTVAFPPGMTINTASAQGQAGCSSSQIQLGSDTPATCPDNSKIGSLTLETPLLKTPLAGDVYLATQGDNKFGSLIALYLVAKGQGVEVKIPGEVKLDPVSGAVTSVFEDNPQLPFSTLTLQLNGGSRAPLALPKECGTYTSKAMISSWAAPGETVSSDSQFTVSEGCGAGSRFAPGFEAGTVNPVAGDFSPFSMRLTGADGEQNLASLNLQLPEGVLAKLAGVGLCPDAGTATGSCPGDSQVGTAVVGTGAGVNPLYVPQAGKEPTAVYLAGPYKGAPYSLVVKVPAQAGPFDLGTVAVRNALHIDPVTARVGVESDPLPQILKGIPITYRDIRVNMDRPNFTVNPTSCDRMEVTGTLVSAGGSRADVADRFQVAGCEGLGFKPKLALRFSGAPPRRGGYPKLKATLQMPKGHANIGKAVVTLPPTEFLENAHIRTICTRVQYAADQCPKGSIYGYAKAWTPLLDKPLQGPVYLRSSNHTLPDLVASLDGQIHIDLAGRIDSPGGRIRNTFWAVPDAPVSKFVLTMQGGRKGLLANNTNLCRAKPRASAQFEAQSGKSSVSSPLVKVAGCGKGRQ